jgi:hypothetical protein
VPRLKSIPPMDHRPRPTHRPVPPSPPTERDHRQHRQDKKHRQHRQVEHRTHRSRFCLSFMDNHATYCADADFQFRRVEIHSVRSYSLGYLRLFGANRFVAVSRPWYPKSIYSTFFRRIWLIIDKIHDVAGREVPSPLAEILEGIQCKGGFRSTTSTTSTLPPSCFRSSPRCRSFHGAFGTSSRWDSSVNF